MDSPGKDPVQTASRCLITVLACVLLAGPVQAMACATDADCDDRNACTANDRCEGGDCVSDQVDCDDGNPCSIDSCSLTDGCQHDPQPNGASCSDGNVCTGEEVCQGGRCSNPRPLDCDDGNPCTADSCAPPLGCRHTPVAGCCTADLDCVDFSACTQNERCDGGACTSDPVSCDDGNPCTTDGCAPDLGCHHIPVLNGIACGDGNVCDGVETCQDGSCVAGEPPHCNDSNACTTDGCDALAGCTVQQVPGCCNVDADCADTSACTVNEQCEMHACTSDPLPCDDRNPCTTDGCDPDAGCVHTAVPNGESCGDLDVCNGVETCQGGSCTAGTAPLCDDGNACTADGCNPTTGCTHDAVAGCCLADGDCADGDACTVNERCVGGACTSTPRACDDGNPCTQDSCLSTMGCQHVPVLDGTSCSDGAACDGLETCSAGTCRSGTPPDCDDRNDCTADSCSNATGCQHAPLANCCTSDADCVDADLCTVNEHCLPSHACQSQARNCDDGKACTIDGCAPATGCVRTPRSGSCDDAVACTTADACNAGTCGGVPVQCDDGNYCDGAETCVASTGTCATSGTTPCSPGSRNPVRTCAAEWYVENPGNPGGPLAKIQSCVEGDPTYDHDAFPISCTFRVAVCLRVADSRFRPECVSSDLQSYEIPRALIKRNAPIGDAFMAALNSLPGAHAGGPYSNVVTFRPALATTSCTPQFEVSVPVGKRLSLKGRATTDTARDKDRLKLSCRAS